MQSARASGRASCSSSIPCAVQSVPGLGGGNQYGHRWTLTSKACSQHAAHGWRCEGSIIAPGYILCAAGFSFTSLPTTMANPFSSSVGCSPALHTSAFQHPLCTQRGPSLQQSQLLSFPPHCCLWSQDSRAPSPQQCEAGR